MNHDHLSQINLLQDQIDAELAKAEPDTAYIDRCVDQILALQNNDIPLSADAVNQKLKQFHAAHRPHKHRSFRKWAAIAACFLVVISIVAVTAYSSNAVFTDIYYKLLKLPIGSSITVGNETHTSVDSETFLSFEEFSQKENVDILYPTSLPDGFELDVIYKMTTLDSQSYLFLYNDGLSLEIQLNGDDSQFAGLNFEKYTTNSRLTYYISYSDTEICYGHLLYDNKYYSIVSPNHEILITYIESLR